MRCVSVGSKWVGGEGGEEGESGGGGRRREEEERGSIQWQQTRHGAARVFRNKESGITSQR